MATENDMNVFTSDLDTFKDLAKEFLWQAVIIPEEDTPLASLCKKVRRNTSVHSKMQSS
jgi:hypothetical protein